MQKKPFNLEYLCFGFLRVNEYFFLFTFGLVTSKLQWVSSFIDFSLDVAIRLGFWVVEEAFGLLKFEMFLLKGRTSAQVSTWEVWSVDWWGWIGQHHIFCSLDFLPWSTDKRTLVNWRMDHWSTKLFLLIDWCFHWSTDEGFIRRLMRPLVDWWTFHQSTDEWPWSIDFFCWLIEFSCWLTDILPLVDWSFLTLWNFTG